MQPKPQDLLNNVSILHPKLWAAIEQYYLAHFMEWPRYCFLPTAAFRTIFYDLLKIDILSERFFKHITGFLPLIIWRYTKGTYTFDSTALHAIAQTKNLKAIPTDVLTRLPEWCVYIDIVNLTLSDPAVYGFFAWLNFIGENQPPQLVISLCKQDNVSTLFIRLENCSLGELYARRDQTRWPDSINISLDDLNQLINLLVYLCSETPEIVYKEAPELRPSFPIAVVTKRGKRLFEAHKVRQWTVGEVLGEKLHKANVLAADAKGRAPHLRRAHWHGYWRGPRKQAVREFSCKWLPPIFVGDEQLSDDPKNFASTTLLA